MLFRLRRLRQIPRLHGRGVTANVVAALVLTRLDYGNALLTGLPQSTTALLLRDWCIRSSAEGPRRRRHY